MAPKLPVKSVFSKGRHVLIFPFIFKQVSTGTGIISYFVNLFVAVPEAFILGNGEYHVEQGSTINLVCVIEKVRVMYSIQSFTFS